MSIFAFWISFLSVLMRNSFNLRHFVVLITWKYRCIKKKFNFRMYLTVNYDYLQYFNLSILSTESSGSGGYRIRNIISSEDWLRIIKRWNLPRNRCEDNFRCCCCLVILSLEKSEALRSKNEWGRIKTGENKDGRWLL